MSEQKPVLIINGPNLNMLGTREPEIYGAQTLKDIERDCLALGAKLNQTVLFKQSNHEGELIDWIHSAKTNATGIIINAGGLTHTSVALHDALKLAGLPLIEVHLSNIYKREAFRHHSLISPIADGVICGLGAQGYFLALEAISRLIG